MSQSMSVESVIGLGASRADLVPSPIRPSWVLEGNPVACNQLLSVSADGNARSYIWDCTAGRFNWFYKADETIYVIEGGVVLTDGTGTARRLCAGDTIFFPAGAHAEWHVENYIRKFALIRTPMPKPLVVAGHGYRFVKRLLRRSGWTRDVEAMGTSKAASFI
jgi:uncharacterized cupin superfamily protein